MSKSPLVSIVTISFNQAEFLEETILSVLGQSYKDIEYIIFDGGSTDGSAEIIERYRDHVSYINIGPDGGASAALNAAFRLATGDFHAYINSDDVLEPHAVESWVEALTKNPEVGIVYGDISIIDETGAPATLPGRRVSRFLSGPASKLLYAAGASVIPQQASCSKAEVFSAVGGFDERNKTSWDGEFFVDAFILEFKAKRIPGVLAKFRVHSNSISGTNRHEENRSRDHARMREKWMAAGINPSRGLRMVLRLYVKVFRACRYVLQ